MDGGLASAYEAILRLVNDNFPPPDLWEDKTSPLADIGSCVIYTRLSRADDKSHSPETQLYITEQTAARQGWKVLSKFSQDADEPISGKAFEARPGWDALTEYIQQLPEKTRQKTCVLVKSFDRFSRNLEEGLVTERVFREELGVRLRAAETLYLAPESKEGWMTFVDLLKFAHFERLMIVERTKQGLATARRKGKHLGEFPRYFEKDAEDRIVPTDTATRVAQLRAAGRSYSEVAREVGVTRQEAFSVCKYLRNEVERLKQKHGPTS